MQGRFFTVSELTPGLLRFYIKYFGPFGTNDWHSCGLLIDQFGGVYG